MKIHNTRSENIQIYAMIVVIIFVIITTGCSIYFNDFYNPQTITCTVVDKDRVAHSDSDGNFKSNMRVYLKDCTKGNEEVSVPVVEVEDMLLRKLFNSADIYAKFEKEKRYEINIVGIRIPLFSAFPRVTEIPKEVEKR